MATTMGFSQNGILTNELYKKDSFKYNFLKYKDNRYTLEQAQNDFQIEKSNGCNSEIDLEEDELEDIDFMLF